MRSLFLILFLFLFCASTLFSQTTNHVVISEVLINGIYETDATSNDEFIEIYNPTENAIDVSGWTIDYRSTGGTISNKYTFPTGAIIQPHKYYLFGGGGVANKDNPTPSSTLGLSNTAAAILLRTSSGVTIDALGWGGSNATFAEGTAPNVTSEGVSLERKAISSSTPTSMAMGGSDEQEGNGYDSNNNSIDFVTRSTPQPQNSLSPAEPPIVTGGSGSGTAIIVPSVVQANTTTTFSLKIIGDGTNTLDSLIIIVPAGWNWPRTTTAVTLSGTGLASSSRTVSGDTLFIGPTAVTKNDSGIVSIINLQSPDAAGTGVFIVKTGSQRNPPLAIALPTRITVTKVIPIINVHINDAQGVPAPPYQNGATVTVSGIITADLTSTRTDVFVQDATAGISIYQPVRFFNYQMGDSVTVTGTITQFRGLTEILLDSAKYILHARSRLVPQPLLLTARDVNATFNTDTYTEPNEGRLVRINGVTYNAANSTITDATGTTGAFISTSFIAPNGMFDLIGIIKQYAPGTPAPPPPYKSDYEIVPRTQADIILHPGPAITSLPKETNIKPDEVTLVWTTSTPSSSFIRFGATTPYSDSIGKSESVSQHSLAIRGLTAGTIYHYQVGSGDASGINSTGDALFSTASPAASSGTINVYFNRSVDGSVASGEQATVSNLALKFIDRINAAKYSIDVCLYSLSKSVGTSVATALVAAKLRGVRVRVIGEQDNIAIQEPWGTLMQNGIQVIDDAFDGTLSSQGLMHNKFAIFDYRDRFSASDDWVWTGSWNATDSGTDQDSQNALEIQDQALAGAYTVEFNEMWGSDGDLPNRSTSRFGLRKLDNTPHRFSINNVPVELHFSPSDRTTSKIIETVNSAQASVNCALLTFTRDDIAQALIAKKNAGKRVRILMDNSSDQGSVFSTLTNAGIDVRLKGQPYGLLHHKYAVVDAENSGLAAAVITGSHNWSSSAENSNNENTLIIQSKRITNLFLQEFKARYLEAGGKDNIVLGIEQMQEVPPKQYSLFQNFPNPFNPQTQIILDLPDRSMVELKVFDLLGREVAQLVHEEMSAGSYVISFNASQLASGVYYAHVKAGSFVGVRKMVLVR
ncbi:MAG: phospholipase D-like domain-containing protein [bacterium]